MEQHLLLTTILCILCFGHSLIYNQPIIKLSNGRGYLLSRTRPLQTTTGLLSNIPRLEYGIRALFRSREVSFYDFNLRPSISMDWKVPISESSHKLINFEAISSTFKSLFNKIFSHVFETVSVIASCLKSSTLKFAELVLPSEVIEPVHRFQKERNELRLEYASYQWHKITQNLESSALAL